MSILDPTIYQQGQGVANSDGLNTMLQGCLNIAQLRTLTGRPNQMIFVEGYVSPTDGGQGPFYWNPTSTATDNGGVGANGAVNPTGNGGAGRWLRIPLVGGGNTVLWLPGVPSLSSFTQLNIGSTGSEIDASFSENPTVCITIEQPDFTGDSAAIAGLALPVQSAPYHEMITFGVAAQAAVPAGRSAGTFYGVAWGWYNETTGQLLMAAWSPNAYPQLDVWEYPSFTGTPTQTNSVLALNLFDEPLPWQRIHILDDGTNIKLGYSADGATPIWLYSTVKSSSYLGDGITHLVFGIGSVTGVEKVAVNYSLYVWDREAGQRLPWPPADPTSGGGGSGGGGSSGAVQSVFGRTGAVTAQTGDYSASQISNLTAFVDNLLPGLATTGTAGIVKPDGVTVDVTAGVISVPTATTNSPGLVEPDGSSIIINNGVISTAGSAAATNSQENRLINGDFLIDQYNEGASTTPSSAEYVVDRWKQNPFSTGRIAFQKATATPPSGFSTYLSMTVSTTVAITSGASATVGQAIEGINIADLGYGTSSAKSIVLSFWAQASIVGNYSLSLRNSAANRSYVLNFNVGTANTWVYYKFVIPGDTAGTWLATTDAIGLYLCFDLGSGSTYQTTTLNAWQTGDFTEAGSGSPVQLLTNAGATLNIGNVRIRQGSFDVPYSPRLYEEELDAARRHYQKSFPAGTAPAQDAGVGGALCIRNPIASGEPSIYVSFDPPLMASPTVVTYNPSASNANWRDVTASSDVTVSVDPATAIGPTGVFLATSGTVTTLGDVLAIHYTAQAEL